MQLTLQHAKPLTNLLCGHCDEPIERKETYKYVKVILGETKFNFHEVCFASLLLAFNKFNKIFLEEHQNEPIGMMN